MAPAVERNHQGGVVNAAVAPDDVSLMEDVDVDGSNTTDEAAQPPQPQEAKQTKTWIQKLVDFYWKYDFLILLIVVVLLAKAYPPLGAKYLAPKITATWIAVWYIFFISGLSLRTEEFKDAFKQIRFHTFIQTYNFLFISSIVYGFTRILISTGALVQALADGMVICACLPMAINMVIILSKTADGDDGCAVFNSAFGNMLGVFLSPLLILGYLGVTGDVDLGDIFYKLVLRVVVPIVVGQLAQRLSKRVADFAYKYRWSLSKSQMYALIFIVYTVFCETFSTGTTVGVTEFVLVLFLQLILLVSFMIVAWYCLKCVFPKEPKLRVTGLFGCTFKTVSLGVPLINAMYEGSPNVAMYILPLLMWYPMQLAIGSILAPKFYKFVQRQTAELACAGVIVDEEVAPTEVGVGDAASVDSENNNQSRPRATREASPTGVDDVEAPDTPSK